MLTDFKAAVTEASESATRTVADSLQRPDNLDKLDLLKRTFEGKRQRVESRLRSVVQTQLDGVQQGLKDLKSTQKEVQDVKQDLADIEEYYKSCADLGEKIDPIREAFRTQQELSTTYVHLEKIFDVPEAVKRTNDLIQSDRDHQNLLVAHRELSELEHIRDELLIQLYHSKEAYVDQNTSLHRYFEGLVGLKDALGQQLWNILGDTLNLVQTDSTRVVTAMKVVEREEKIGVRLQERLQKDNIPLEHIPGRPVGWRAKVVEVLEQSVRKRFARFHNPDESEKGWIRELLQDLGRCFFQDLLAAKSHAVKCFPQEYQIFQFFVTQYHQNLQELVEKLIQGNLDTGSILLLMSWAKALSESVYTEVGVDLDDHGAVVPPHLAKGLEAKALDHINEKVTELIDKLISFEKDKDWNSGEPPGMDSNGHLCSPLPRDLFEVIQQNVSVMNAIGPESTLKAVSLCWEKVKTLQDKYEEAISEYASEFFTRGLSSMGGEPLPRYKFFMPNIMAAANNCLLCIEYIGEQRNNLLQDLKLDALEAGEQAVYQELCDKFEEIGKRCLGYLVDFELANVEHLLASLCKRDHWLGQKNVLDTILKTIQEYDEDFKLMKPEFHDAAVLESQHRLVVAYGQAMMERRMKVQTKERKQVKEQVVSEARQISDSFYRLCSYAPHKKGKFLQTLAEIWTCDNTYLLPEILQLNQNFEGLKESHMLGLLSSRSDMDKKKAKELCHQAELSELNESPTPDKSKYKVHGDRFEISKRSPLRDIVIKNPIHLF